MRTQCPHCQVKFKGPDSIVGKKVKCPKCKEPFVCAEFIETIVPLSAPKIQKLEEKSQANEQEKNYGGISRTVFILGTVANTIIYLICIIIASEFPHAKPYVPIIGLILFMASIYLIANRLENIGWSGWWWLLIFVPIVSLFIALACCICPEGYRDTKKLDTEGKFFGILFVGLMVLIFIIIITILLHRPSRIIY